MIPMLRVGKLCWGPTLLPCQFHLQEPSQNRDKSGLFVGRGGGALRVPLVARRPFVPLQW